MAKRRIDTQSLGLDIGLAFVKWLTGKENLHYGLWTGLDATAGNLRAAQEAYTDKLIGALPDGKLRILDIGGGSGESAKRLLALGHQVDIVVPSPFLAERCRANAPGAEVHQCRFEELQTGKRFDLCLFSESFQYIPMAISLAKSAALLDDGGQILLADCFRSEAYSKHEIEARVGGGHPIAKFREMLARLPFEVLHEEDITSEVAASVDLEQGLFNVVGHAVTRVDQELAEKRPVIRWLIHRLLPLFLSRRRRVRLNQRLGGQERSAANFKLYNRYLVLRLRPVA